MKKILVVDDRPEVRELLRRTLAKGSYETFCADNGADALTMARERNPDLILMDILMPGDLNGTETARMLKSDPQTKYSKIVILSGRDEPEVMSEALEAGADGYFTKPFSPLDLLRKIEELLVPAAL
ncbi:MAG: response regulator [Desulfomonilaceae bacterium]|nr:response regulator [Desulfomonilaceae bacterium]